MARAGSPKWRRLHARAVARREAASQAVPDSGGVCVVAHSMDFHNFPLVEELTARSPFDAPQFSLDMSVPDFYDLPPASVTLEGYQAHPLEGKIQVAV